MPLGPISRSTESVERFQLDFNQVRFALDRFKRKPIDVPGHADPAQMLLAVGPAITVAPTELLAWSSLKDGL